MAAMERLQLCFNPSFTGIALVAINGTISIEAEKEFQSFFYWNCLGGHYVLKLKNLM